jgi:hypothetical protein
MTERLHEFEIGDQPRIEFRLGSGDLRIVEGDPGKIRITLRGSDRTLQTIDVQQQGNAVSVVSRKKFGFLSGLDVGVTVPRGTAVHAKLASMDLIVDVPLDRLTGSVASGDVTVGDIESDVELHSASGDIRIGRIGGNAKVTVASGDIRIDEIGGNAAMKSGSGDIDVVRVRGRCECKTASGDIVVQAFEGRSLQSSALAGDVVVGLPPGRTLDISLQTLAGDVRNEFDVAGEDGVSGEATLDIKTLSGDIVIRSVG